MAGFDSFDRRREPRAKRTIYLYVRSDDDADFDRELDDVASGLGLHLSALFPDGEETWLGGTILLTRLEMGAQYFASENLAHLGKFDAWVALDNNNGAAASKSSIEATRFFVAPSANRFAQICFMWAEDSPWRQSDRDRVLECLGGTPHLAFEFLNGEIWLLWTDQPSELLYRRCEDRLSGLKGFVIIDGDDNTKAKAGNPGRCWELLASDGAAHRHPGARRDY